MKRRRYYRGPDGPQLGHGIGQPSFVAIWLVTISLALAACRGPDAVGLPGDDLAASVPAIDVERLHVVMINGGGRPARNYQSHLLHLRELRDLVVRAGVDPTRITIFASDGEDPAADLAVGETEQDPAVWLIEDLPLMRRLGAGTTFINSAIDGAPLRPATRAALSAWFREQGDRMRPGDTLLVYVTDHGRKNRTDLANNAIVLWGEDLDVNGFRELLGMLPRGVRVVFVMSQCFSGSFANLMYDGEEGSLPSGAVCGYFSAPADRYAYGCYPENRGRHNVGHGFHFLDALAALGALDAAHEDVVLRDRTPDVPLRTSNRLLADLLRARAARDALTVDGLVDRLLTQARDRAPGPLGVDAAVARLAARFGMDAPPDTAATREQIAALLRRRAEVRTDARRWRQAFVDLKAANLERFFDRHPAWQRELSPAHLSGLEDTMRAATRARLLADLMAFTKADRTTWRRLTRLRRMSEKASAIAYRLEVRIAVLLRIVGLYREAAGRELLEAADSKEVAAYAALRACEALRLHAEGAPRALADPAFPRFEEDERLAREVRPGWLGIAFEPVDARRRDALGLAVGPVVVRRVYPGSPAEAAGLRVGDIVLGPPSEPFHERNQIREWVMTSPPGKLRRIEILHEGTRRVVEVRIGPPPA